MEINTSDFAVERTVIYADENGVVYDDPVPELQSTWNKLARHYALQAEHSSVRQDPETRLRKAVEKGAAASHVPVSVAEQVELGHLKTVPVVAREAPILNIKRYILSQILGILKRKKREFFECVTEERMAERELLLVKQPVSYAGNSLRIYLNAYNYLEYTKEKNFDNYPLKGLLCVLKYKKIVLKGYACSTPANFYDRVSECYYEQKAQQKFYSGNLEISIESPEKADEEPEKNPLCLAVLSEIRKGRKLQELIGDVYMALSRFFLDQILAEAPEYKIYNTKDAILSDGRSNVFFAVTGDTIYKVSRGLSGFEIRRNGQPLILPLDNN